MKQYIRVVSLLLVLVFCAAAFPFCASAEDIVPIRGDCSGDEVVNMKDVLFLRQFLAGIITELLPHDCYGVNRPFVRADCNADGAVNMKDVLTLRKLMAGLIDELPLCSCQEEAALHTVTAIKGSANVDEAMPGDTVFLTADLPEAGYEFDRWICDSKNAMLDDAQSELATFVMPNEAVALTATYKKIVYTVYVIDGEADNDHPNPGDVVTVRANKPHPGEKFDGWAADGVTLDDTSSETVSFVMPECNVSLMATYCEA